jgi:hypothetical protein
LIRVAVPASARETAAALFAAVRPPHDAYRSAVQLLGMSEEELAYAPPDPAALRVNDRANFYVRVNLTDDPRLIPSRVRLLTEHAVWWASVDSNIPDDDFVAAAEKFETLVLPTNRLVFGTEASPGLDGDARIHFLVLQEEAWGGYFGYFSSTNSFPTALEPFSNVHEMLVMNALAFALDSDTFPGKLAHEYQHLIQWNVDANEDLWLNEALSELAYFYTGAPVPSSALALSNAQYFAEHPEAQLTARPERRFGEDDPASYVHYGAEKAFLVYLFGQFGAQFIADLAHNPAPGVVSIEQELAGLPNPRSFDEVFADWLVANLLLQPSLVDPRWAYTKFIPVQPVPAPIPSFGPAPIAGQLPPYGARYYEIRSEDPVSVSFTGSTLARLTPVDPATGSYAWYSHRGDGSAFTLTRAFDLSGLSSATLEYKVWFELEELSDYAYLEISTDGGETWTILTTAFGTAEDPYDLNYGFGYTGALIDWVHESIDLSAFAGREVLIRFEVITDFHTNRDGLMLDDIAIPELGYFDGAEDDDRASHNSGGWDAQGFVRSGNFVPVNWIVWLVEVGPTRVTRIEVDDLAQAAFAIEAFNPEVPFAAVIISPAAPVTTIEIPYEITVDRTDG